MAFWKRIFGRSKEEFEDKGQEHSQTPMNIGNEIIESTKIVETLSTSSEGSLLPPVPEIPTEVNEEINDQVEQLTEVEFDANVKGELSGNEQMTPLANLAKSDVSNITKFRGMPLPKLGEEVTAKTAISDEVSKDEEVEPDLNEENSPETDQFRHDHLEDLTVIKGQILPILEVPEWRDELKFVEERYEPCDLANHIVKVSKRRLISRRIELELAESRLTTYERYLERASRRFKDKVDENNVLNQASISLSQWQVQHSKSVAWRLVERINEEILRAERAEKEATGFLDQNKEFSNPKAIDQFRHFARRVFLIPVVTLYLASVLGLTYSRFEWIFKFFPPFNLGLTNLLVMVAGISSGFWLANLWRYSKHVSRTQKQFREFKDKHETQYRKIKHSVLENARLSQQGKLVEGKLEVLAKAYRVQLQSDTSIKAHATTFFDPNSLPACVTLARAVDNDEAKMARLKKRALSVLMSPGWRTKGLDLIARIHADSKMLDSNSLSLKSLDTDSVVSAKSAQKVLLEAFGNLEIHDRVSKSRLVDAIRDLHFQVLAKWESEDRPKVVSLRDDGFNKLSFRSSWLVDEDNSEDWIKFLTEILTEETAHFGTFNILDKGSAVNKAELIESVAVVPNYFPEKDSVKPRIVRSDLKDVMPMDVVVRVDVSPWEDPSAFAIFAKGGKQPEVPYSADDDIPVVGGTSV